MIRIIVPHILPNITLFEDLDYGSCGFKDSVTWCQGNGKAQELGLRVLNSGLGGLRVRLGSRVHGLGFSVQASGLRPQG